MAEIPPALASLPGLTEDEIDFFSERAGVCEFDGNLTHEEAERFAIKAVIERRKKAPKHAIEARSGAGDGLGIETYPQAPETPPKARYSGFEAIRHMTDRGIKLIGVHVYKNEKGEEKRATINNSKIAGDYEAAFTNDFLEIKALAAGVGDTVGRAQGRKITMFYFIPRDYDLLCLDIDRNHADGVDGPKELYKFFDSIGKTKENLPPTLRNLPESFPCYVTTPSGGVHLYFKYRGPESWGLFANVRGVEIKNKKPGLTAPGSQRPSGEYILFGNLDDAPLLPAFIKNRLTIPKADHPPGHIGPPREKKTYGAAPWNLIKEWVYQDGPQSGRNNLAFALAVKARTRGWEKSDTLRALHTEPDIEGLPESEIISVVNSAYKKGVKNAG